MSSSFLPLLSLSCKSIFHPIFHFPNTTVACSRKFLSFSPAACPCSHLLCSACLLQSSVMALLAQAGPLIPPLIFLTVPRGCLEDAHKLLSYNSLLDRTVKCLVDSGNLLGSLLAEAAVEDFLSFEWTAHQNTAFWNEKRIASEIHRAARGFVQMPRQV